MVVIAYSSVCGCEIRSRSYKGLLDAYEEHKSTCPHYKKSIGKMQRDEND